VHAAGQLIKAFRFLLAVDALLKPNAQVAHHLFGKKRFHSARINRTRSALDFRNSFGGQRRLVGISQLVCKSTAKREL